MTQLGDDSGDELMQIYDQVGLAVRKRMIDILIGLRSELYPGFLTRDFMERDRDHYSPEFFC